MVSLKMRSPTPIVPLPPRIKYHLKLTPRLNRQVTSRKERKEKKKTEKRKKRKKKKKKFMSVLNLTPTPLLRGYMFALAECCRSGEMTLTLSPLST